MKKTIYSFAIFIAFAAAFASCNSPSNRAEKAQENLAESREELNEAKADAELQQQKAATAEEWTVFKSNSEVKIKENETRIAEIKAKMMKPGHALDSMYQRRINVLEEKNNNLRTKVNAYENNQSDWESFKREYNHDMDEIGKAFKDITIDNKK